MITWIDRKGPSFNLNHQELYHQIQIDNRLHKITYFWYFYSIYKVHGMKEIKTIRPQSLT
jgi:hypothetical protein